MLATFLRAINPKWLPLAMLEITLFYGLAYNASKYMVSVTFWVGGFIIDVVLII